MTQQIQKQRPPVRKTTTTEDARCPHCHAVKAGWVRTCSRCGGKS